MSYFNIRKEVGPNVDCMVEQPVAQYSIKVVVIAPIHHQISRIGTGSLYDDGCTGIGRTGTE